jgi:hypothetical protein
MEKNVDLGKALERYRKKSGLSYSKVTRSVWKLLGDYAPTDQTVSNYHHGLVQPENADPFLMLAFAKIYGIRVRNLSPTCADRLEGASELLNEFLNGRR